MIERELKFAIDPHDLPKIASALAAAAGQDPSRSTLVSTYFDTTDRALKKRNMALRVRRQGRRFVQTVKTADSRADFTARGEWEDPIREAVPDLAAVESGGRIQQVIGIGDLKPLFTTTVRRSTVTLKPLPTTSIEAALDEGEIRAAEGTAVEPICEIEFELKSGEPATLYDMALRFLEVAPLRIEVQSKADRGYRLTAKRKRAPPVLRLRPFAIGADATVETMLQEVGRRCLHHVVRNQPAALAAAPEAVHQMRVAVRRLRSALSAIKPMLSPEHYAWANGELKALANALSAPRDWDVFAEHLLRPLTAAQPGEEDLHRLARVVARARRRAYGEAKKSICAPDSTAAILRLLRWFEARAWRDQPVSEQSAQLVSPIGVLAPILIGQHYRRARKLSKNFAALAAGGRHKLRIALKKLRYTIDFLEGLFDNKEVDTYLRCLKPLQNDLGHTNDVRTAHAILARLTDEDGRGLDRAGGIVLGWHDRGVVEQEKKLRKHVRRFRRAEPFW